jgi:hypothetical protein
MASGAKRHRLSDGTTITLRQSSTLIGTQFTEVHSVRGVNKNALLWTDGRMYALHGRDMMRITNPDYSYSPTKAEAARKALAFFVDTAESVIEHAKREGIPVADCY